MDTLRKQASRLREQVARQQQVLLLPSRYQSDFARLFNLFGLIIRFKSSDFGINGQMFTLFLFYFRSSIFVIRAFEFHFPEFRDLLVNWRAWIAGSGYFFNLWTVEVWITLEQLHKWLHFVASLLQLQAVLKQFVGGYGGSDNVVTNEAEFQLYQKLEKLYISTRAAKVFFSMIFVSLLFYLFTCLIISLVFAAFSEGCRPWCRRLYCY